MNEIKPILDEQLEYLEQRLIKSPDDTDLLFSYGETSIKKGLFLKALNAFEKILARDSTKSQVYLNLAKIYYSKEMWGDSLENLKKAAEIPPLSIEGFWLYNKLSKKTGKEEFFFEPVSGYENFNTAQDEIASFQVKCQLEIGDVNQLIGQYQTILKKSDFDPLIEYDLKMLNLRKDYLEDLFGEAKVLLKDQVKAAVSQKISIADKKISLSLYEEVKADIRKILESFIQMRSVAAVAVFDAKGEVLEGISRKPVYGHNIYKETLSGIEFVNNWAAENKAGDLNFWVVEFSDGLWLNQKLSKNFLLSVIGEGLINFGAIKYSLEKYKPQLVEILKKI